jgi:hypothetical protein
MNNSTAQDNGHDAAHDALRALAILLASIAATTVGVRATRCGGYPVHQRVQHSSAFHPKWICSPPRQIYGIKVAFGEQQEIFIPSRSGGKICYPPFSTADYDNLVASADRKRHMPVSDASLIVRTTFPTTKWGLCVYGKFITFALLPTLVIAAACWILRLFAMYRPDGCVSVETSFLYLPLP